MQIEHDSNKRLSMATSGEYRNYYVKDAKTISHTINPKTLESISQTSLSVSVKGNFDCMSADAYATWFNVIGPTKSLEIAKNDILNADIIIANLLFLEEHVRAILPTLKTKRDNCDALVGCISSKEVVSLTRMDRLDMSKPTSGFLSLLKKLRGSNKSGKPASGKRQMSILRRLPKILRFIPGKAQDVRSYFLTMLYWLGGSDDNVESMIIYLCQKYLDLPSFLSKLFAF